MKIYFNWLNDWIELNDEDLINDMSPTSYIKAITMINEGKDILLYEKTIIIRKGKYIYHIPANLLVWKEEISNLVNEERWD